MSARASHPAHPPWQPQPPGRRRSKPQLGSCGSEPGLHLRPRQKCRSPRRSQDRIAWWPGRVESGHGTQQEPAPKRCLASFCPPLPSSAAGESGGRWLSSTPPPSADSRKSCRARRWPGPANGCRWRPSSSQGSGTGEAWLRKVATCKEEKLRRLTERPLSWTHSWANCDRTETTRLPKRFYGALLLDRTKPNGITKKFWRDERGSQPKRLSVAPDGKGSVGVRATHTPCPHP